MAVFNTREIAPQQPGAPFDVALRKAPLSPVTSYDFPNIYFWFFFWHGFHTFQTRGYITQQTNYAQEFSY